MCNGSVRDTDDRTSVRCRYRLDSPINVQHRVCLSVRGHDGAMVPGGVSDLAGNPVLAITGEAEAVVRPVNLERIILLTPCPVASLFDHVFVRPGEAQAFHPELDGKGVG